MKTFLFNKIIICVLFLTSCNSVQNGSNDLDQIFDKKPGTEIIARGEITFEKDMFDFGKIKEGELVVHTFTYKNTGLEPIIVSKVSTSCGCTKVEYVSTPIAPNATGEIKVILDSHGQIGKQQKILTIVSNAQNNIYTIQLRGEVG